MIMNDKKIKAILKRTLGSNYQIPKIPGQINSIYVTITQIGERLTDNEDLIGMNVVPIAVLFSGGFVCLDFRETEDPTVVVWYHEESGEFSPVTKTVAQNISEFFEMLKI